MPDESRPDEDGEKLTREEINAILREAQKHLKLEGARYLLIVQPMDRDGFFSKPAAAFLAGDENDYILDLIRGLQDDGKLIVMPDWALPAPHEMDDGPPNDGGQGEDREGKDND